MNLEELETAVVKLPQSDFDHFVNWFQNLLSKKDPEPSLETMLERVTEENLHVETLTGVERGREQRVW